MYIYVCSVYTRVCVCVCVCINVYIGYIIIIICVRMYTYVYVCVLVSLFMYLCVYMFYMRCTDEAQKAETLGCTWLHPSVYSYNIYYNDFIIYTG